MGGNYIVALTCKDGSGNQKSSSTSIYVPHDQNNKDLNITVLPNPSSKNFTIRLNSPKIQEVAILKIFDAIGQMIDSKILSSTNILTFGDSYHSGLYYVMITQGKKQKVIQLIKQ